MGGGGGGVLVRLLRLSPRALRWCLLSPMHASEVRRADTCPRLWCAVAAPRGRAATDTAAWTIPSCQQDTSAGESKHFIASEHKQPGTSVYCVAIHDTSKGKAKTKRELSPKSIHYLGTPTFQLKPEYHTSIILPPDQTPNWSKTKFLSH
jgi:hypothetical protein